MAAELLHLEENQTQKKYPVRCVQGFSEIRLHETRNGCCGEVVPKAAAHQTPKLYAFNQKQSHESL